MSRRGLSLIVCAIVATIVAACATSGNNIGPSCTTSQTACGQVCVDTSTDSDNCGACGTACPFGEACVSGACTGVCPHGTDILCGADAGKPTCVNAQTDNLNCGSCGHACGAGTVCAVGSCVGGCGSETKCTSDGGLYCADLKTDNANCGACGTPCGPLQACMGGMCIGTCNSSQTLCTPDAGAPYCADLMTDNANCGTCGTPCSGIFMACQGGGCTSECASYQTLCTGDGGPTYCADPQSDNTNCGVCGFTCGAGLVCSGGKCANGSVTVVEIFPPTGTNEDPGNASVWSARYYTVSFVNPQTIEGIAWRANLASSDYIYAEIRNPSTMASLAKGTTVYGSGLEQFYNSPISYSFAASTNYLVGIFMSNANTVFPRKDTPSYPFTVSGPHGNIDVTACWSTSSSSADIFPTSTNFWGPDFKLSIQ